MRRKRLGEGICLSDELGGSGSMSRLKGSLHEAGKKLFRNAEKWFDALDSRLGAFFFSSLLQLKIALRSGRPPDTVHIEPINICNARCVMCPYTLSRRKRQVMPLDLFKKIIDDCARFGVNTVVVTGLGEPLLDPTIYEKLKYAVAAGLRVRMVTNASSLDREATLKILETGIHQVAFSVDGYDKRTYENIRKGLCYESVVSNIVNFLEEREKRQMTMPKTLINFVSFSTNKREETRFRRFWENKVDFVRIAIARSWQGTIRLRGGKRRFENLSLRVPCELLWMEMAVYSSGVAVACCTDWRGSLIIGDLTKQKIDEVWFGEKAERLRRLHLSGKRGDIPTCRQCEHFFSF